jgi:hypothetical protein
MRYLLLALLSCGLIAGCKEESKKTETTVTTPSTDEAPAKVEEKTTTEEKE